MNRYRDIKTLRNTNRFVGTLGDIYYKDVTYPEYEPTENDIYVETEFGDRLDLLAYQFYGDVDLMGTKIIVYTVLLFPPTPGLGRPSPRKDDFYLTNEYEYELVGYLMMEPVDIKKLSQYMGGGLVL